MDTALDTKIQANTNRLDDIYTALDTKINTN